MIVIVPIFLSSYFYIDNLSSNYRNQYITIVEDSLERFNNRITWKIENLSQISQYLSNDISLKEIIEFGDKNMQYIIIDVLINDIIPKIEFFNISNTDIYRIAIIHNNSYIPDKHNQIYYNKDLVEVFYADVKNNGISQFGDNLYIKPFHKKEVFTKYDIGKNEEPNMVISFCSPIFTLYRDKIIGYVQIDIIESNFFKDIVSIIPFDSKLIQIVDDSGNVIYPYFSEHQGQTNIPLSVLQGQNTININNTKHYIVKRKIEALNASCLVYLPKNHIKLEKSNILVFIYFLVISTVLSTFITYLVSKRFTHNIIKLTDNIEEIGRGNFNVSIDIPGCDEISRLGQGIYAMENKINELLRTIKYQNKLEQESIFKSLQNQLKPHFLCNSLNIIRTKAKMYGDEHTAKSIELIISYFQYNMSSMQKYISIKDEIKNAIDYIKLRNLIIDDEKRNINYQIHIESHLQGTLDSYYTLKFILQPLIENSIKHGFENASGNMIIIIALKEKDEGLIISVEDNGIGIPLEKLRDIEVSLSEVTHDKNFEDKMKGGLYNIKNRLLLNFGSKSSIHVSSYPNIGTCVEVVIPIIRNTQNGICDY